MVSALVSVAFVWLLLQLLVAVLRYGLKLKQLGLGWFSVSVQTATLNRCLVSPPKKSCSSILLGHLLRRTHSCRTFYTMGRKHHSELRQWFGLGVLVAAMLGISAAFILLRELWHAIQWADRVSQNSNEKGARHASILRTEV